MITLKKIWLAPVRALKKNRKYFWLIIPGTLLSIVLLYFAIAPLWVSREAIALAELEKTFLPQVICHEKCLLFRQARENLLAKSLKKREARTIKLLDRLWKKEDLSPAFRRELVKIFYLGYGGENPPFYLKKYLIENQASPQVIREIVYRFPLITNGYREFRDKLSERLLQADLPEERVEFLKIIREISSDSEIDNYFSVLTSGESEDFKREAVKNISNTKDKAGYFKVEQLEIIKDLVLSENTPNSLRRDLTLLISDYYLIFPNESAAIWQKIYNQEDLDSITRLFSADNLNHLGNKELILPEISPEEWAEYYN